MVTVRYDHAVIIDGVFYPADTDIPVKTVTEPEEKPEKKAVKKNDKRTSRTSKAGDSAE